VIRLFLWGLLIYIGYRIIIAITRSKSHPADRSRVRNTAMATQRDPICGVYISEEDAVVGTLDGQRHYFCSHACLEKFREQLDHTAS
jgi:YHS domain-containing protein